MQYLVSVRLSFVYGAHALSVCPTGRQHQSCVFEVCAEGPILNFYNVTYHASKIAKRASRAVKPALILGLGLSLVACSGISFGPNISTRNSQLQINPANALPTAAGESLGNGPVRVALLLPLSGNLSSVGTSMANGAKMAMRFVQSNPSVNSNITLVIKDTAGDPSTAAAKASEAVREGASLILGPLRSEAVQAAGSVARSAGIPMIGFSNNSGAAAPGVYLLNVLPEGEVRRSLAYAKSQGRQSIAAIVPTTDFGRIQEGAFRQAVADLGLNAKAVYTFSNESEARASIEQLLPQLQSGAILWPSTAMVRSWMTC